MNRPMAAQRLRIWVALSAAFHGSDALSLREVSLGLFAAWECPFRSSTDYFAAFRLLIVPARCASPECPLSGHEPGLIEVRLESIAATHRLLILGYSGLYSTIVPALNSSIARSVSRTIVSGNSGLSCAAFEMRAHC